MSIFALIFGVLSLIVMIGMLGVILGILQLTGLLALDIILGFMALFGLVMVYVTAAVLVSKVVVSYLGGQLILKRIKPEWAKSRIWPLLLGLVIFAILTAIPLLRRPVYQCRDRPARAGCTVDGWQRMDPAGNRASQRKYLSAAFGCNPTFYRRERRVRGDKEARQEKTECPLRTPR